MKYRNFIPNSPKVSEVGMGAWQLGVHSGWKSMTEKEALHLVHKAHDVGINFFDTAPNYGHGTGETRLGKALKDLDRTQIVVNTKFGHTDDGKLNFETSYIRESLDKSLKRLQLDYVDSLIIHNPPSTYLDGRKNEHYDLLEQLKKEGKIKAYGASIDTSEDMKLLMNTTNAQVMEIFFNILHQDTVQAFEIAKAKDMGIIVKVPLDSGWLTGKYHAESAFNDIRSRWSKKDIQIRAKLVEQIKKILSATDDLPQKSIAFCLAYDAISTVIPGNLNPKQLQQNAESSQYSLSPECIKTLETFYQEEVKALKLPW